MHLRKTRQDRRDLTSALSARMDLHNKINNFRSTNHRVRLDSGRDWRHQYGIFRLKTQTSLSGGLKATWCEAAVFAGYTYVALCEKHLLWHFKYQLCKLIPWHLVYTLINFSWSDSIFDLSADTEQHYRAIFADLMLINKPFQIGTIQVSNNEAFVSSIQWEAPSS